MLADHYVDIEIEATTFEVNNKLVAENEQRRGLYHKYSGLLHDSWFIKANITSDKFSITLNDFTTPVFSDLIVDKKKIKIDHEKLVFPIQVDLETINL